MNDCNIPIRIDHLPATVRIEAATWCVQNFNYDNIDLWTPLKLEDRYEVACFRFASQKDANWFALRWL